MGIQAFPMLADQSMRKELHIVRKAIVSLHPAELDELTVHAERLGCVRGVIFAFAFQAVLAIGVAVCWKLLH
jgi:hypothetical protein